LRVGLGKSELVNDLDAFGFADEVDRAREIERVVDGLASKRPLGWKVTVARPFASSVPCEFERIGPFGVDCVYSR
jgi:hypothetical protein